MADSIKPNEAFTDIVQRIADAEAPMPRRRAKPSTPTGLIKETFQEYPRAATTATVLGVGGYNAVQNWRGSYLEGLKAMRERFKQEQGMTKGLVKKGLGGMTRLAGDNNEIRALAKEYAVERTLTGFPFYNPEAKARIADLKTPRVILNSEGVPLTNIMTPAGPKQVTKEGLKAVGKPFTGPKGESSRVAKATGYVPVSGATPSTIKRIAQLSTGGKLGRGNVLLEGVGVGLDVLNPQGDIQDAYRQGRGFFGDVGGVDVAGVGLAGLKTLSRAGRGASNALTLGAGEYLGVYDTIDLLQARSEAREEYLRNREKLKLPVRREGKELVPVEGPYLQMFEAQAASKRGIEASPIIEDWYKGPAYDYKVHDGKLISVMKPEYAALYESNTDDMLANQLRYRDANVLNVDPTLGNIGYPRRLDPSKNDLLYGGYGDDGFVR